MVRLHGRTALVFGSGSSRQGTSNGMAACMAYARAGARVIAVDKDGDAAGRTADAILGEGGACTVVLADVRSESDVVRAVAEAAAHGPVDILHNNVGILRLGGAEALSTADWDASMEINVRGMFLACKHTLPIMVAQKRGTIVNISSVAGWRWCARPMVGYSASKAAVNQMTQAIAVEYAPHGIRCNAIIPGLMDTPMVVEPYAAAHSNVEAMVQARNAMCPTGRMGTPWDVANAAVFLASDDAAYVSGALLAVDGALSCKAF